MSALSIAQSLLLSRKVQYLFVVCVGFVFDIGVALFMRFQFNASLVLSTICGFSAAVCINYLLFEFAVWRKENQKFSLIRFCLTWLAALATLGVRILVINGLSYLPFNLLIAAEDSFIVLVTIDAIRFVTAASVSFIVNGLLISRIFNSFSSKTTEKNE